MLSNTQDCEMFACQICPNKNFKTEPALKGHNTRFHKNVPLIAEIIQVAEPVQQESESTKICREILFGILDSFNEQSTQKATEDSAELIINQTMDDEIDFDLSVSEINQQVAEIVHSCESCEQYKEYIKILERKLEPEEYIEHSVSKFQRDNLLTNGIFVKEQIPTLKEIPDIVQDVKMFKGKLQFVINNKTYNANNLELFEQYESDIVDPNNRVQSKQEYKSNKVALQYYKADRSADLNTINDVKATYLNMRVDKKGNQFPPLFAKLSNENPEFKCVMSKNILNMKWDIETYDTENDMIFPMANRPTSHISMISLVYNNTAILYCLDKYTFNTELATQKIKQHCGQEFDIQLISAENERDLVVKFVLKLIEMSVKNTIILAGFNSSQDGQGNNQYGYDGSFLVRNLGMDIHKEVRRCKGSEEFPEQLIQLSILPNVYFVDFLLMFDENTPDKKPIEGRSLNSYLKYFKIPTKLDGDHKKQRLVQINGGNVDEYGTYCLYDSICLQIADEKRKVIDSRLAFTSLGLPLSMVLYQTTANMLTCCLMQKFFKQGLMFTYSKLSNFKVKNWGIDKQGAYTKNAGESLQYKKLLWTMIFDFKSQFPNAGIQNNISPETYEPNPQPNVDYHIVQINYQVEKSEDDEPPIFAHFKKDKAGIISSFQLEIYNLRKAIRTEQKQYEEYSAEWLNLEVKQLFYKEQINSMYGIQNDDSSQLFKYECGSSITGFARKSIGFAIELALEIYEIKEPTFVDTDSTAIQVPKKDCETREQYNKKVNDNFKLLNKRIADVYPRMELEFEKQYDVIMYPKNKKSYVHETSKWNDTKQIWETKWELKGVAYNKFTLDYRGDIQQLFHNILNNNSETYEIIIENYKESLTDRLYQIIDDRNVAELQRFVTIHKMSKRVLKKTNTITLSGYLAEKHSELESLKIIPYNCHQNKRFCQMPIEKITCDNIDNVQILNLVKQLVQPINQFFNLAQPKSAKYSGVKAEIDEVVCRIQTGFREQKLTMKIKDFLAQIKKEGSYKSFHCIITGEMCKMYFDVEHNSNLKMTKDEIANIIREVIGSPNVDIHILDGCKNGKLSYHFVLDIVTNKQVNKFIANLINRRIGTFLDSEGKMTGIVDLKVYNNNQGMRMPNCVKVCDGITENRKLKIVSIGTETSDFIISNTSNIQLELIDKVSFQSDNPVTDSLQFDQVANIGSVEQILKDNKLDYEIKGNQIQIKNKPYSCPACKEVHKSNNLRIVGTKIQCYEDVCCGIEVPSVKTTPTIKRLENAHIQSRKLIKYKLSTGHHIFIKSQMGTGKTEQLQRELHKYPVVLVLSFRKSFANEFSDKMGITNYQSLGNQQEIYLSQYPKLCIQLESLHKVIFDIVPDLVVFDEYESIQNQFNAFGKSSDNSNNRKIQELMMGKCLFMDALLQQSSIDYVKKITGITNVQVYENTYQTQSDRKMIIQENPNENMVLLDIKKDLELGKKLSVNCSSKKLADKIYDLGKSLNKVCAKYTGDDNLIFEQFGVKQSMGNHKLQQLKKPADYWGQLDLLVFTGTISAGISYTDSHFDIQYGILKNKSSDVITFIQGNHRVRNLKDQTHKIYMFTLIHKDFRTTPLKVMNQEQSYNSRSVYIHQNQIQQFNTYLLARSNVLRFNGQKLFSLWSGGQGYQITRLNDKCKEIFQELPQIIDQSNIPDFAFTEDEFIRLPSLAQQNDFCLSHCDVHMNIKLQICRLANIFALDYNQIMDIYSTRTMGLGNEWEKLELLETRRIQNNLIKIALNRTSHRELTEEHYTEIEGELMDYLHSHNRFISVVTSNLNHTTYSVKTQYIKDIISALRIYKKYKDIATMPAEELLKITEKKNRIKNINQQIEMLGYKIDSGCKETKIVVDGKRTSQRTYSYSMIKQEVPEELKHYLN